MICPCLASYQKTKKKSQGRFTKHAGAKENRAMGQRHQQGFETRSMPRLWISVTKADAGLSFSPSVLEKGVDGVVCVTVPNCA